MYEIIEKIDGNSLYDIWHTLNEVEKENIIKDLCNIMKIFHSHKGKEYNWIKRTSEIFLKLFEKVKEKELFTNQEINLIEKAYQKFPIYLESNEFVLVHNDLHFDNIFYKNGKIKILDFERSLYAPKDFELDIIYRMIRKPWKFASEENEKYTKVEDYKNIMLYIEKYYPELINTKYLYKRLAIYDILYYLKHYLNNPTKELKEDIMNAVDIVVK